MQNLTERCDLPPTMCSTSVTYLPACHFTSICTDLQIEQSCSVTGIGRCQGNANGSNGGEAPSYRLPDKDIKTIVASVVGSLIVLALIGWYGRKKWLAKRNEQQPVIGIVESQNSQATLNSTNTDQVSVPLNGQPIPLDPRDIIALPDIQFDK